MKPMKWAGASDNPRVIVLKSGEKDDAQITLALQPLLQNHECWEAFVQLIEQYREQHANAAGTQVAANNSLAAAGHAGVYSVLTEFLDDLESRRQKG